ncbi:DUF423 domain-containing protein [Maribacter halichondriae]|uniref:DUF423 domain-containing protein n=1 Tax=Maribacter halichondriae TaxID=2980554 RepID=UPI0023582D80|nr:DUF423 domain-containing protein [Maribacter sp. Hal144]
MNRTIFLIGILLGVLAIILGAFGAHGLEKLVDSDAIATFETGVRYQMYHALFLLVLANLKFVSEQYKKAIFYLTIFGVVLFSFSIYFLATNSLTGFDFKSIGFITPIGGVLLVLSWTLLGYRSFKSFD